MRETMGESAPESSCPIKSMSIEGRFVKANLLHQSSNSTQSDAPTDPIKSMPDHFVRRPVHIVDEIPAHLSRLSVSSAGMSRFAPNPAQGRFRQLAMQWGSATVDALSTIGDLALFTVRMLRWMVTRRPARGTLLLNFYQVGALSLPVVALTGTFIGMVLAVQSYPQFHAIGLDTRLGAVINATLVRELGPVLAATMLAGRVGSAMAAVLGTMRVTEQIDALTSMGADPIHYLVVPRFLACILLIPALTIMADFMGIVGGYFYSVIILDIDHAAYLNYSRENVTGFDLFSGIFKSFFFGAIIAVVSCYRGFHCEPGAEGVGKAATTAFVYSFVLILTVDLLLTIMLNAIYYTLHPGGVSFI